MNCPRKQAALSLSAGFGPQAPQSPLFQAFLQPLPPATVCSQLAGECGLEAERAREAPRAHSRERLYMPPAQPSWGDWSWAPRL